METWNVRSMNQGKLDADDATLLVESKELKNLLMKVKKKKKESTQSFFV